jgi:uncharacterized protein YbaP (TraB family)
MKFDNKLFRGIALVLTIGFYIICSGFSIIEEDTSLLWKIEGNGLKKPSYLFGTVHMICSDQFTMQDKVKAAIEDTEQSYLEIDLDDPNMMTEAQKYMLQETALSTLISPTDLLYVDSLLNAELGMSLQKLNYVKPLIISAMLIQKRFTCPIVSMENEIIKVSKDNQREIYGLSSVEEQYSFLNKIFDVKDFIPYLRTMLHTDMNRMLTDIQQAYLKEDLTSINQMLDEFSSTNPESYNQLLTVRNQLWTDRIPTIIEQTPTFIAVGCAHLSGPTGMINILKKKGYKVTAVH